MRVLLSGSHGLIGRALADSLTADGWGVVALVRPGAGSLDSVAWDPAVDTIDHHGLEGHGPYDAVVHLAGAGIGDRRWNADRRREIRRSRVAGTRLLAGAVALLDPTPSVFVSASAIGYYGDRGEEELTEESGAGTGFLAEVCQAWENATRFAQGAGIRVVIVRTGIVLSPTGGALARQLPLFRLGVGARLGRGSQWVSWITLVDEVAAIRRAIDDDTLHGPLNATAPGTVTNRKFTSALGAALRRPAFLTVPTIALNVALGSEMARELLLSSQRVRPAALEASGHRFAYPEIDGALAFLVGS
jgi:hypothetical protein